MELVSASNAKLPATVEQVEADLLIRSSAPGPGDAFLAMTTMATRDDFDGPDRFARRFTFYAYDELEAPASANSTSERLPGVRAVLRRQPLKERFVIKD